MKSLPDNYKLKKTVPKSPKDLVELLPHPQQQQLLLLFHPHQDLKVVQEDLKPKVHPKPIITVKRYIYFKIIKKNFRSAK